MSEDIFRLDRRTYWIAFGVLSILCAVGVGLFLSPLYLVVFALRLRDAGLRWWIGLAPIALWAASWGIGFAIIARLDDGTGNDAAGLVGGAVGLALSLASSLAFAAWVGWLPGRREVDPAAA